ncbi:MAG: M20 aminoacylase family protein [Rhodoferax sp.]
MILAPHSRAFAQIAAFHPELTAFRRELHANPELGFEEHQTARRVAQALQVCGVDAVHTGIGRTGVVALIHGRSRASGRAIGLRADMDALPLTELGDRPWKSTRPGLMHACGHDGHTAMLLGAARYLAQTRQFDGTAVLIFQPGEEGFAGAQAMIDDGLFERFPVESVYALHNWPALPAGYIGLNPGPMMAAADKLRITVTGRGGHGAHPDQTVDPVLVAAHLITALQSIVSRNLDPVDSGVISVCALRAGDPGAMSVIPDSATLVGTVRTFLPEVQALIEQRLHALCAGVAQAFGAQIQVTLDKLYPATINHAEPAALAAEVAQALVGPERVVRNLKPSMGAEDFSFMLRAKPGAYLRLGQGPQAPDAQPGCALHNPAYDFNDAVLPLGAALHASLVEHALPLESRQF